MKIDLTQIIESINQLNNPTLNWEYQLSDQDKEFIKTTINGDEIKAYLPLLANLKPKTLGILLYVVTNVRLIKIEISNNEKISSVSYFLNTLTTIDRKLIDNNKISINIVFQNISVGLTYSSDNSKITAFFQTIEELKAKKASVNA